MSSTYTDLHEERQAAVEAILTAGHIPAGMELFAAGDESQMEVIKQWIDESDVYLLILGGRYGSIDPKNGKSYVQLEYEYAVSRNMPLFSCVITEKALDERLKKMGKAAIDAHGEKLEAFRSLVLSKMVRFWDDSKDIKITVGDTLAQFSRREDIGGWVRQGSEADLPALADEIARLSKENAHLRAISGAPADERIGGLTIREMRQVLEKENLLSYLMQYMDKLASNTLSADHEQNQTLAGLVGLGLVEVKTIRDGYNSIYGLTDGGRIFANTIRFGSSREYETVTIKGRS